MQLFLDAIGVEFKLFFWVFLGAVVGLVVELNTEGKKSSVLFLSKLEHGSTRFRVWIYLINILAGALFAYVGTPFILDYLKISPERTHFTGFLVGVASLSLLKGYAHTWRNKKKVTDLIFKVIDVIRSSK